MMNDIRFKTNEELLPETFYLVDASGMERHFLWEKYSHEKNDISKNPHRVVFWKGNGCCTSKILGYIDDRPIVMCITYVYLDEKLVGFWEMTSQLCDYKMAEEYLRKYIKHPYNMVNADNFHNCVYAIKYEV